MLGFATTTSICLRDEFEKAFNRQIFLDRFYAFIKNRTVHLNYVPVILSNFAVFALLNLY